ncbi:MAG: type II toxin-antitoxin system HicA family toxin [Phycisphaerae bacterium]|nr:type II toxin-antitoxin system HicA family toxin [Phycisphaerae bacterium]
MRLPRDLSGRDLIRAMQRAFGYRQVHQQGSHVILQVESPRHHRVPVPDHKTLRVGTLNAIITALSRVHDLSKDEVTQRLFG